MCKYIVYVLGAYPTTRAENNIHVFFFNVNSLLVRSRTRDGPCRTNGGFSLRFVWTTTYLRVLHTRQTCSIRLLRAIAVTSARIMSRLYAILFFYSPEQLTFLWRRPVVDLALLALPTLTLFYTNFRAFEIRQNENFKQKKTKNENT